MGNQFFFIIVIVAMVILMWFMNRQQKKRQQQQQEKLNQMEPGSEIVTIGGLHGVLHSVSDRTVEIDCEGVILTFEKSAIRVTPAAVNTPAAPAEAEKEEAETEVVTDPIVDQKQDEVTDSPIDEK